jgi:hypothetical protein
MHEFERITYQIQNTPFIVFRMSISFDAKIAEFQGCLFFDGRPNLKGLYDEGYRYRTAKAVKPLPAVLTTGLNIRTVTDAAQNRSPLEWLGIPPCGLTLRGCPEVHCQSIYTDPSADLQFMKL